MSVSICLTVPVPADAQRLREESVFLRARIDGREVRLETLIVRLDGISGRLPLALIAHGRSSSNLRMGELRAADYASLGRDLARRGWLAAIVVRRGFGQSDGPFPTANDSCKSPNLTRRFNIDADEMEAAISALKERPDVETERFIALGESAGGAAMMALAQRKPAGLRAVINVAGGLRRDSCLDAGYDGLVETVRGWGWKGTVPQLWIYARNDEFFPPAIVERMRAAALDKGGNVRFIDLPEIKPRGHAIFTNGRARFIWLREMDASLRAWHLPTLPRDRPRREFERLKLEDKDSSAFENYFAAPGEKALAFSESGKTFDYHYGGSSLEMARRSALSECEKKASDCRIAFENDSFISRR